MVAPLTEDRLDALLVVSGECLDDVERTEVLFQLGDTAGTDDHRADVGVGGHPGQGELSG